MIYTKTEGRQCLQRDVSLRSIMDAECSQPSPNTTSMLAVSSKQRPQLQAIHSVNYSTGVHTQYKRYAVSQ
eukprot:5773-Heterococcus_DN1.PRE.3